MTVTSIRAEVLFKSIANAECKYIPRVNLFKTEWIDLKGNWTEESIKKYCNRAATKLGYKNCEIDIEVMFGDGEEAEFSFICE